MSARRISAERLAVRAAQLDERDQAVLAMLAAVKLATGTQLRRAVSGDNSLAGQRAARRQLARLVRWRMIGRLERRQGGPGAGSDSWTYGLDTAGQRLLVPGRSGRRPHLPRPASWQHVLVGAEIYTRLVEALRGGQRHLQCWQGEPAAWRDYVTGYGERQRLKPDAFTLVSGGGYEDVSFLEVDIGTQSRPVIRQKLYAYQRYAATGEEQRRLDGVFPRVVFITTTLARHAVLVDLLGELPADAWRLFAVGLVDDAARLLSGDQS